MKDKMQVYAVVRIDVRQAPEEGVTIKEILPTLEEANQEVARLNRLNEDKGARYFCQATRYFPEGRGAASSLITKAAEADGLPLRS